MSTEANKALIRSFFEAGNAGDIERAMGLMSDRVSWTNIGSTEFSGTFEGKQDLGANLLGPVFSRLDGGIESTIELIVAEGDHVVVLDRGRAVTTDGQAYNNTYCHIFRIEDGKIVEVTEYFDTALTQTVLGSVIPR